MAEYAGYVSSGSIDWSGIAKGLQENVNRGLKARQAKIDEDNKLFDDTKKKLGEYENTQSPSYNTRAYQLTSDSRSKLLEWNKQLKSGEITRDQFKINTNNLYEQYDSFVNTSKQFDQYISEVNKKIQSGEAGAEYVAKANANMAFMGLADGSAELQVGADGGIYVSKDGTPISIKQWTNIQNLADGKIDVNEQISKFTDKVADVVRSSTDATGASVTTEDARQKTEQYNAIKRNAIATVANRSNPSSIVSILMDNSDLGYQIFMNDNDIKKAVDNAIQKQELENGEGVSLTDEQKQKIQSDIESKAIMYTMSGDGSLNPTLTDAMIADAEKVAGEFFEAQIDSKITTEAAQLYRGNGGDGGGKTYTEEKDIAKQKEQINQYQRGYLSTMKAFGVDPSTNKQTGKYNFSGLDNKFQYRRTSEGVEIYKAGSLDAKGNLTKKASYVGLATEPKGLAEYAVYGRSPDEAITNYERGRTQYRASKGLGGSPKTITNEAPNAATAPKAPR